MAIIKELTCQEFEDEFLCSQWSNRFSIEALDQLHTVFEEYSETTGKDYKLEVAEVVGDWVEEEPRYIAKQLGWSDLEQAKYTTDEQLLDAVSNAMNDETLAYGLPNGKILFQSW